ncbi:MAG: sulfurtransferase complex subunit TusC [Proteobacteria bacterium]|nr:sulfurtransferase complex subunit TusC [Pseudomonadota bacterium]
MASLLSKIGQIKPVKKILFALRKPPHSGAYVQEMLDIIMTVAAFDQEVSIILLDNAVFQLKKQQQPELANLKATAAIYKALPLFGINDLYTETESLQERGLNVASLEESVIAIPRAKIGDFFKQFDLVLTG